MKGNRLVRQFLFRQGVIPPLHLIVIEANLFNLCPRRIGPGPE